MRAMLMQLNVKKMLKERRVAGRERVTEAEREAEPTERGANRLQGEPGAEGSIKMK